MTSLAPDRLAAETQWSWRLAAWGAKASGIVGIIALGCLTAAFVARAVLADAQAYVNSGIVPTGVWDLVVRAHDVGVIVQALLMIPVVFVLHAFGRQRSPGLSRATVVLGVVAHMTLVLCLSLICVTEASDMLYMVPQGLVGLWLILVNWLVVGLFSRGFTRAGTIAGLGLVVIGGSCLGIAAALGWEVLAVRGPVPAAVDPVAVSSTANRVAHTTLFIGTLMGIPVYPIWAIVLGRGLLRDAARAREC